MSRPDQASTSYSSHRISARTCPFTGVLNYFSDDAPYVAIASITSRTNGKRNDTERAFLWRCTVEGHEGMGVAPDLSSADALLRRSLAARASCPAFDVRRVA